MTPNHLRGLAGTRYARSLLAGRGNVVEAQGFAAGRGWQKNTPDVVRALAVDAVDTTTGAPLVDEMGRDFAALASSLTILGRLPAFRRVPLGVRMLDQTGAASAYWAGQGRAKGVTRVDFEGATLGPAKVVALAVVTEELLMSADPAADAILSQIFSAAIIEALDRSFIDPASIAIAGARPASVTSYATPISSTGTGIAEIDADLGDAVDALSAAGSNLANATWVLHPRTATYLSRLRGTGGAPAYPGMGAKGGALLGLPAIASASVPVASGGTSGDPTIIALVDPSQIRLADEGETELGVARHATLQLDTDPTNLPAEQVSLWQLNLAALRIERRVNWQPVAPAAACQVIDGVVF